MSLILNHNIAALNTQRNLEYSSRAFNKSLEKLSSGYKINVAADDPAGLIISEQLRSQTEGLSRAIRNSQEASNVIGITEAALIEMNEILRSMRELAIHAANNGITSPEQVAADQAQVDSGIQTIDRIANTTKYSDQFMLNGSKAILYDQAVTQGNNLLDTSSTRLDQVFKREGLNITLNFAGYDNVNRQALMSNQSQRAFFEADEAVSSDVDALTGTVVKDQQFIITGNSGARQFQFVAGTDLASIASSIENLADSTGVHSQLILASDAVTDSTFEVDNSVYDDVDGAWNEINDAGNRVSNWNVQGFNSGMLYASYADDGAGNLTVNLYSDVARTLQVATAAGTAGTLTISEVNNSGISGTVDAVAAGGVGEREHGGIPRLRHLQLGHDRHTTPGTRLYATYQDDGGGNLTVDLYSDVARTVQVATGTRVGAGTINLAEVAASGISGTVDVQNLGVAFTNNNITFTTMDDSNDQNDRLDSYNIVGVKPDQRVYVTYEEKASGELNVNLYSNSARTSEYLLATGSRTGSGLITLTEENNSGISGSVLAAAGGVANTDNDIYIDFGNTNMVDSWSLSNAIPGLHTDENGLTHLSVIPRRRRHLRFPPLLRRGAHQRDSQGPGRGHPHRRTRRRLIGRYPWPLSTAPPFLPRFA